MEKWEFAIGILANEQTGMNTRKSICFKTAFKSLHENCYNPMPMWPVVFMEKDHCPEKKQPLQERAACLREYINLCKHKLRLNRTTISSFLYVFATYRVCIYRILTININPQPRF